MKKQMILILALILIININLVLAWADNLNDRLTAYYNLSSEDENVFKILNLTNGSGSPIFTTGNKCLIGGCINLTASRNAKTPSNNSYDMRIGENRTLNFWLNPNTEGYIFSFSSGANSWYLYLLSDGTLEAGKLNTSGTTYTTIFTVSFNNYTMITLVNNITNILYYMNGTYLEKSDLSSTDVEDILQIGYYTFGNDYDGYLDELGFWDKTLNSSEIEQLYNNGLGISYSPPPFLSINIIYPTNTSYNLNVSNLNYSYSATSDGLCWYSTDNGLTNSTPVTAGENFADIISNEGNNNWNLYCNSSEGLFNSTQISFYKDAILPLINIIYPINADYNKKISQINYTISDINSDMCWYSTDNGLTNSTPVTAGINFTGLTTNEGNNNWIVYCNDTLENENLATVNFNYARFTTSGQQIYNTLVSSGAGIGILIQNISIPLFILMVIFIIVIIIIAIGKPLTDFFKNLNIIELK